MTGVDPRENLEHPSLEFADSDPTTSVPLLAILDDGGQVGLEKLQDEHGVLILAPEVLVQYDDVGGVVEDLKGLDLAESGLVIVDLLERHDEIIGETTGSVDVGICAGANPLQDLVLLDDFGSGVDAPALGWWRVHL